MLFLLILIILLNFWKVLNYFRIKEITPKKYILKRFKIEKKNGTLLLLPHFLVQQ